MPGIKTAAVICHARFLDLASFGEILGQKGGIYRLWQRDHPPGGASGLHRLGLFLSRQLPVGPGASRSLTPSRPMLMDGKWDWSVGW
jgi:hypothetical protein